MKWKGSGLPHNRLFCDKNWDDLPLSAKAALMVSCKFQCRSNFAGAVHLKRECAHRLNVDACKSNVSIVVRLFCKVDNALLQCILVGSDFYRFLLLQPGEVAVCVRSKG